MVYLALKGLFSYLNITYSDILTYLLVYLLH